MITKKVQAITGVSSQFESVIEDVYPSIASTGIGESLNQLFNSIPIRIWGIKVSHVFALMLAPFLAIVYLLLKVFGCRYLVTNRSVKRMKGYGFRMLEEVPLAQIAEISIDPDSRQEFFSSADVRLTNSSGATLMLMRGIPYPERFQQVILEARDARTYVNSSLLRIQARK